MKDKLWIIIISADLCCCKCREKIREYLCRIQWTEGIKGIVYDQKNGTVELTGYFNPHELVDKLKCKLGRVIKSIEIKDPEKEAKEKKEKEEKEKKEKEEKEKKEKEEKEKKEKEEKEKKEKCIKELREKWEKEMKEKCEKEKEKCIVVKPIERPVPVPVPWPTGTQCCYRPCACINNGGWNNNNNCNRCCSCGNIRGGGGENYNFGGATKRPFWEEGCNSNYKMVIQDYPSSTCSIM